MSGKTEGERRGREVKRELQKGRISEIEKGSLRHTPKRETEKGG